MSHLKQCFLFGFPSNLAQLCHLIFPKQISDDCSVQIKKKKKIQNSKK